MLHYNYRTPPPISGFPSYQKRAAVSALHGGVIAAVTPIQLPSPLLTLLSTEMFESGGTKKDKKAY